MASEEGNCRAAGPERDRTRNREFLLNPTHPDAKKFKAIQVSSYPFDVRLKK